MARKATMCWPREMNVAPPFRILLADDNPAILEAVEHMLRDDFIVVGTARDSSFVLKGAAELKPDLIILDISMGNLNGLETTRRLRDDHCRAKIMFLTVHEELEFVRAAFDAGASGYVFKSRMSTDLLPAIEMVMDGKVFLPGAPISQ